MNKLKLILNNGAARILAQVLGAPGFLTETSDIYRAGQLLEEQLLDLPMPPEVEKGSDMLAAETLIRAWQREGAHAIEVSERQRETAKKAVQAAAGKGALPPGAATLNLFDALGLVPEA